MRDFLGLESKKSVQFAYSWMIITEPQEAFAGEPDVDES